MNTLISKLMKLSKLIIFTVLAAASINVADAAQRWIPGHYYNHYWVPGHYVYVNEYRYARPGYVWVDGGWDFNHRHYHRGYWRRH